MKKWLQHPTAPACFIGLISYIAAIFFIFIHPGISAVILSGFVMLCLAASFVPGMGIYLPVIQRGTKTGNAVAITFDDGPHPLTTPLLLKTLARHGLKATFFVIGRNAEKHPDLIRKILHAGHCIGNHTYCHDVFIMTKPEQTLEREIDFAQAAFKQFGIRPLAFRPPVGIVNPKLGPLLKQRGMICIHYSCRGPDLGNRRIRGLSGKILKKIRPGDIVLLHDTCPPAQSASHADAPNFKVDHFNLDQWIDEIEKIIAGISQKGLRIIPLPELINGSVMIEI